MCESRGDRGPDPLENHKLHDFLLKLAFGPHLEKVGPPLPGKCWSPLDFWKSIVFSVIKPLDPLSRLGMSVTT